MKWWRKLKAINIYIVEDYIWWRFYCFNAKLMSLCNAAYVWKMPCMYTFNWSTLRDCLEAITWIVIRKIGILALSGIWTRVLWCLVACSYHWATGRLSEAWQIANLNYSLQKWTWWISIRPTHSIFKQIFCLEYPLTFLITQLSLFHYAGWVTASLLSFRSH
jgi:hypothetical protein